MSQLAIEPSHVATLHYVLADERGRTLDDSRARQRPLEYLHGHGNLFPALESALAARRAGERLRVTLAPGDTYGQRDEALVSVSARSAFPQDQRLQAGQRFQAQGPDGPRTVTVVAADDTRVTVDANHPLAGETLTYDIEVLEVREATRAELAKGHPLPPGTSHTEVEDRKR
ncbi:MAG: peptidylprolyl isomerase [Salinicola sp.]|uniref:FKBP-type peptidyl-prolyl cis-trans isomerase n=1 Tax=Salinicola sp. TaxID=1978524 RepID=UPI000C91A904|nr:peptidylprolyl isomerase [Salinicola sp.]MAM58293.1 peptidylprolyl isomerase [Salinicola sp.]NRB56197.1 peptidylprolyl isomerase [Salinicola sp.]